ncbi:MAG: hypothetical protein D6B28_10270 [Gammaproteobacteria bacterium]|nr:MAG: hypothetical protein D6B28_10270 [Gammaproteobacteria bacterium]
MQITRFAISFFGTFLFILGSLYPPAGYTMDTFETIFKDAIKNDPALLQKQSSLLATKELTPQARALLLPTIAATGAYNYSDVDSKNGANYHSESTSYGVSLQQPILDLGAFSLKNQADATISQAEYELKSIENELITRVAKAYFEALAAQDNVDFAEDEKKSILKQLEQSKKRHEYGQIAATGVYEAQARYDLIIAEHIQAENTLLSKLEALQEITGRQVSRLQPIKDNIPLQKPVPNDVEHWNKLAMQKNPQLLALNQMKRAAEENISYKKSARYPTLDLTGAIQRSKSDGITENEEDSATIGISLSIPIYTGGNISSTIREAKYQYDEASYSVEQVRRSLIRQIRDSFRGISSNISQVNALQQALKSNEIAFEATEAGYEVGTRTMVDLLNAQTELHRARLNLKSAKYNLLTNQILLKQAAGTISNSDITALNKQLAPTN